MRLYAPPFDSYEDASGAAAVGVVIPTFNRRQTLLDTLPYVLNQTQRPDRLVIVDDGSTDDTVAAATGWLRAQRPEFPWQVIAAPHRSAASARNVGLDLVADLPLVTFLDSDDHWPTDFLERGVRTLQAHPAALVAVADRRFFDAAGRLIDADDSRSLARDPIPWFFQYGAGLASCTVLRTSSVVAVGGWPTHVTSAEDAVLFAELTLRGPWVHLPGDPVEFHWGTALARHEEQNLSQCHDDRHRQWAMVFEGIYQRVVRARPTTPRGELHRALAQRWYWAGKQLFALGQADEARQCFARAVARHPMMFRAWRRLLASPRRGGAEAAELRRAA
ncbi:glycosyltransferase [Lacipirellula limnantheis]|uniref:Putative glycosyl transferase n=1 Tax=Lacipirellula limnantheis TaxID=2528024 RepID=A0A517TVK6_9BACT|nr:glycosyltransferase [Lacipirellula limnantheis]QDT72400.1 putative glycosyl transferase [Lacipirellula limnantheis]